jgi:hypothetical protein
MAFEQRAGVMENLENFVLCHRTSFKFQVSSFKPDCCAPGWSSRFSVPAEQAKA